MKFELLGNISNIRTGKYDANHSTADGQYKFYTCAFGQFKAPTYSFEGEAIVLPGNGANVGEVFYNDGEKFEAYQRTYVVEHIKAYPKYIFYYFKSAWRKSLFNSQYGSATNYIRLDNLTKFKIPLPPLKDQIHIANILSKAEALISQRKESLRLLDEFLKNTFLEMFGDPVKNEKRWRITKLMEITKVGTGGTPSRKKEAEYYNGKHYWSKTTEVNGNKIYETEEKITEAALKESNCKIYPVNTILLAMYGQGKTRGNVGLLKIEAATNQACAAIPPSDSIDQVFLFELLKNSYLNLRSLARGGNQENLNLRIVGSYPIILPPLNLQTQFAHIVEKTEALKTHYQTSLQELENLYGSLSQRAFSPAVASAKAGKRELNLKGEELAMAAEPEPKYSKR